MHKAVEAWKQKRSETKKVAEQLLKDFLMRKVAKILTKIYRTWRN